MPTCNPEDYLDLDSLELLGPSAVSLKSDQPAPLAAPEPQTIDDVANALRQAQLRGDQGQIGVLSLQLDDMLSGKPSEAPVSPQEQPKEVVDTNTPEADEEPSEEQPELLESDFNRALVNQLGAAKVDALYETVNNCGDEDVIEAFMESVQGDGQYANEVLDWARLATDAGATPDPEAEYSTFSEENITAIRNESPYADEIIALNQKLNSGEISQAQLFQQVLQDPALMAEAVKLRNANIISF